MMELLGVCDCGRLCTRTVIALQDMLSRSVSRAVVRRFRPRVAAPSIRRLEVSRALSTKDDVSSIQSPSEAVASDVASGGGTPWYMRQEESSKLTTPVFKAEKPEIPEGSPASLDKIVDSMIDLGLNDFKVFDIRDRDDIPMSSMAEFCVICEGKSEKHLQNAAQEIVTMLKHEFSAQPYVEGMTKQNESLKMKKRLKMKKPINDFGVGANSWIMIDSDTGVFLNLLTQERRSMLNLEYLWCKPEDRPLYENSAPLSQHPDDSVFAGIFRRFYSTQTAQTSLESKGLQCFQLNDETTFDTISQSIRNDPSVSLNFLQDIVNSLECSDVHQTLELFPETNKYIAFFNKAFPLDPTRDHWNLRFRILSIMHNLFPEAYSPVMLVNNLLLQSASGFAIEEDQLRSFVQFLSQSLLYNDTSKARDLNNVIQVSNERADVLYPVLRSYNANHRSDLPDDIILSILKFYTQQHLYSTAEETLSLSPVFDVLLDLLGDRPLSADIVEVVLVSYLKANNVDQFWSFWESLPRYTSNGQSVSYDSRPWNVLASILKDNYHEKLVDGFLNDYVRCFIDSNDGQIDADLKHTINELLDRFDGNGTLYPELRK